jgi:hypothetical protein
MDIGGVLMKTENDYEIDWIEWAVLMVGAFIFGMLIYAIL